MTSTAEPTAAPDLLDSTLGLQPDTWLHAVRHARDKVASATQGSHDLFFDPALQNNLPLNERLWVATDATRDADRALPRTVTGVGRG